MRVYCKEEISYKNFFDCVVYDVGTYVGTSSIVNRVICWVQQENN